MSAIPRHKDRLSALEATYPLIEHPNTHMHISALVIFEGPAPKYSEYAEHIESRLHLVPRFRQKLAFPPFGMGRPIWIDDSNFALKHHARQIELPQPDSEKGLHNLAERIISQQLDRTRPLWEFSLVRGLNENRFAVICKIHHSLVDPISIVNIISVFLDLEPVPEPTKRADRPWVPCAAPSKAEMAIDGLREHVQRILILLRTLIRAIRHPLSAVKRTIETVKGLRVVARALFLNPAPKTFLNVDTGPHRSLELTRFDLGQLKQIKQAVGGTVNDVVLAVVARALTNLFKRCGHRVEGLQLEGLVPVWIKAEGNGNQFDIHTSVVRGPLPLDVEDPLQLLQLVRRGMVSAKESKQITAAKVFLGVNDFLPPALLARAAHLTYSTRLFNLIVTNIHGPQTPLYLLGRRLLDFNAVVFLPKRHALAIAIMSYDGGIYFNFLADPDVLPDLHLLREDTEQAFAELYEAATGKAAPSFDGDGDKKTPQTDSSDNPASI